MDKEEYCSELGINPFEFEANESLRKLGIDVFKQQRMIAQSALNVIVLNEEKPYRSDDIISVLKDNEAVDLNTVKDLFDVLAA